jgi:DNA-binding GntR family transcriptional regulator
VAYRELATEIREAIRSGKYADGSPLPTEEQLAASHSLSRQTIRRALQDLVSEGIIYRVPGRGTYPVAKEDRYVRSFDSVEELLGVAADTECEILSPLQRRVDIETAGRLRLRSDEVSALTLVRLHADVVFCHTSVYLPPSIGDLVADAPEISSAGQRSRTTVVELIDARIGGVIAIVDQSISAAGAPVFAASHLGCAAGEPVLRIDRLYMDDHEQAIQLAISYYNPERYSYRLQLRRRPT